MEMAYKLRFRGKDYFVNAPMVTPQELERLIGAARTPNSRLIMVRGTTAVPVSGSVDASEAPQLEEIPTGTVKGGAL
jgi:hypothetical protein